MLKNMNWILGINSMNDLREVIEKNENIESGKYYYLNYDGKELIIRGINNDLEGLQLIEYIIEKNGTLINFEKKSENRSYYVGNMFSIEISSFEVYGMRVVLITKH